MSTVAPKKEKILMAWSGGKDSSLALYHVLLLGQFNPTVLITTINEEYDRVSMHGVRRELVQAQADSLGVSLEWVCLSKQCSMEVYEAKMAEVLVRCRNRGFSKVAFGDIFLEQLKIARENSLSKIYMQGLFPNWKKNTAQLARKFIKVGFKAIVVCVDSHALEEKFAGRLFDDKFLADLPSSVDPCGENGEFHTFVYDGPIFKERIYYTKGETVFREGRFFFCDLVLTA